MKKVECPICKNDLGYGTGAVECPICDATGKLPINSDEFKVCESCEGSGLLLCNGCHGAKEIMAPDVK